MIQRPIGFFDSGVGGLSIWKAINELIPTLSTRYIADSAYAPYGQLPKEVLVERSVYLSQKLIDMGCGLIVVACNTATTNAISHLRAHFKVPFVGIEPAIKPAALASKTKKIGVLATAGTLSSELFHKTVLNHAAGVTMIEQSGDGLVEAIESPLENHQELEALVKKYITPMAEQGIDSLVLGCTHYPYLIPMIKKYLPEQVQIIDSGAAVARQTERLLKENELFPDPENKPSHEFYTTGNFEVLKRFVPKELRSSCSLIS